MRVNVDKVLERDQKLSELDDRAGTVYHKLLSRRECYQVSASCCRFCRPPYLMLGSAWYTVSIAAND